MGRTLTKFFPGYGRFRGRVVGVPDSEMFAVRYDDGDAEDLHSTDLARLLLSEREQDEEDLLMEDVTAAMAAGDAGCEPDIPVGRHTASERHNGVAMRGARLIFRFDAPVGWVLGTILRGQ